MEETPLGESIRISCERCRRRKIKCDRKRPCSRCVKAGTECILNGSGEKQRPISKAYVQALEGQVASLELLIRKLTVADNAERDEILSELALSPSARPEASGSDNPSESKPNTDPKIVAAQVRSGQLRRPRANHVTQFFGGTSLFHIHLSRDVSLAPSDGSPQQLDCPSDSTILGPGIDSDSLSASDPNFMYAPHDETSQTCMAAYFKEQYQFHMLVYREYFLRDYDVGSGRYYSDALLFAICSLGALQLDGNSNYRSISEVFANQAQSLIYASLDSPDLTTLQALCYLGFREIGVGHSSKGWLFCGMAFRLAHEMGLHLDPNNWDGATESNRDTEILRRVYWAIFVADKQMSLYFGRPPALHPNESDVRNTIRLQYPPDWEGLLDTYICKGASATEFEDGVALVGALIYQAELGKIIHVMITELFENRRGNVDAAVAAARSRQIHVSLTKWLSSLPGTLHWNQWTVGQVPPTVLRLHMFFHTVMIILHRPPSHLFEKQGIAESEDVEICYESLQAILRLMRTYSRHYRYRSLPLDFVQTLSTAAGAVMMKRFFQNASWDDPDISRSLSLILDAMEDVEQTWPCVAEIKDCVIRARRAQVVMPPEDPLHVPDLMNGLELSADAAAFMAQWGNDLGTLVTDEFLSIQLQNNEQGLVEPFDFNHPLGPPL